MASIHGAYLRRVEGFEVAGHASTLTSGRDAIDRLIPTLVLLDIYLPDGNGLDLLREALEPRGPRPDFLVITAARDMQSVRDGDAARRRALPRQAVQLCAARGAAGRLPRTQPAARPDRPRRGAGGRAARGRRSLQPAARPHRSPQGPVGANHGARSASLLQDSPEELSAAEIAAQIGISRSTAQRYLAELARQGKVELRLHYGAAGRPEHRYRLATGAG